MTGVRVREKLSSPVKVQRKTSPPVTCAAVTSWSYGRSMVKLFFLLPPLSCHDNQWQLPGVRRLALRNRADRTDPWMRAEYTRPDAREHYLCERPID
jgi:hypothetical protein